MSDAPIDRHETLRLQFKEAMDWGRSYGTRLNLSSITVQDVSGQYADIALAQLDALAKAEDPVSKEQYRSMFHSACADLGAISDVLGVDPDEGGADPILAAIADLQALADLATPAPTGLGYLCHAWGESDHPVFRFAATPEGVGQFFCDEWFGAQPSAMPPSNREQYDDAMALVRAERDDPNSWDGTDMIEFTFEIGGIQVTRAHFSAPRATPFMYAIQGPDGKAHMDEMCVSGAKGDLQDSVYHLNDEKASGPYREVPVFLVPPAALPDPHWPVEVIASDVCQAVAELGDRNSPEGQPAMLLVTSEELHEIVMEALNAAMQPLQEVPHV